MGLAGYSLHVKTATIVIRMALFALPNLIRMSVRARLGIMMSLPIQNALVGDVRN
jgi:hypothetical protein